MPPSKDKVLDELDRIKASDAFRTKPIMQKLLHYLVTETLAGRADYIKGYSIGLDVFGQSNALDPDKTTLVRNNAVRLRALLETYYLGDGKDDPVIIDIPKGKYIARFQTNQAAGDGTGSETPRPVSTELVSSTRRPGIAVLPLQNLSRNSAIDYVASGFSQDLCSALTKFDDIRVFGLASRAEPGDPVSRLSQSGIDFFVDGDVQMAGAEIKVSFRLVETADNLQLWGDSTRFNLEKDSLFDIQERITAQIASLIGGEYGHVNLRISNALRQSRAHTLTEQTVLLRYYHHLTVVTEESLLEFQQAAITALENDPDSALLNACVAGNYSTIWSYAMPGADEALKRFAELSERAYALDPKSQWVQGNLASKCFHFNEKDRFLALLDRCEAGLPNTPLRMGIWAMWLCYFGYWERGKALLDRVFADSLEVPMWLHCPLSLYHYRNGDFDAALVEAKKIQLPGLFWGPLLRCVNLAQLGSLDDAEAEYAALLEYRPDFEQLGQTLIGRMVKEPSLREHLNAGLSTIGRSIA